MIIICSRARSPSRSGEAEENNENVSESYVVCVNYCSYEAGAAKKRRVHTTHESPMIACWPERAQCALLFSTLLLSQTLPSTMKFIEFIPRRAVPDTSRRRLHAGSWTEPAFMRTMRTAYNAFEMEFRFMDCDRETAFYGSVHRIIFFRG